MKKTPTDEAIDAARLKIDELQKFIWWLQKHRAKLDLLPFQPTFYDKQTDFDNLSHDGVVAVMKAFGAGKWVKTLNANGSAIDYETEVDGRIIRCWSGEPPPNCKIIEEQVFVPAEPARIKTVRKLVCLQSEAVS